MSLIGIILALVLVGLLLWALEAFIPMNPTIKRILEIVVVIVIIIWLLQVFGILGAADTIQVKPIR
jgi:hypothetical protein